MKLNWAERWAVNNPIRPLEQHLEIAWMRRKMPLREASAVLEVGCGRGAGASLIFREFRPSMLHAMDLDMEMIRKAVANFSPGDPNTAFMYVGDVFRLPYRGECLDAVFGFGVLHHVPDWRGALTEIARVLKTGGLYFLEEIYPSLYQNFITKRILLHPRHDRFFSRELKEAIKQVGLTLHCSLEVRRIGILGVCVKGAND
jgi:ubiquinone/menaquinone biosynthesis C-methylase UbiE